MRKLFLFALSLLSFVDNQHLGVKNYFRMKEGPKDEVKDNFNITKDV
jgi:hypothetical protein